MSVRETLGKLENMVVGASKLPFSDKVLISDAELIGHVEELRSELPKELARADEIMKNRDTIISNAEKEAEDIRRKAREYANAQAEQSEIVKQANEKARNIYQQAQDQARETVEQAQDRANALKNNADAYADQVFEQLISHITGTFDDVRTAAQSAQQMQQDVNTIGSGLQQAVNMLQQFRQQMNQQSEKRPVRQQQPQPEQAPAEEQPQAEAKEQ